MEVPDMETDWPEDRLSSGLPGSFFTVSVGSPTILFQGSFVEAPFYTWSEH